MVSLKDIAEVCGVSVATVSKALNGHSDIGAATKERIRQTAREMGYLPNTAARALKTHRTYNIGVLLADEAHSGLTHDYFAYLLESFRAVAESKGYDITFVNNKRNGQNLSYYEKCRSRNFDGVLIACVDFEDSQVREVVNSSIPVVTIDHIFYNCTAIMSDNVSGMRDLLEYVIARGHRRIAYIHGRPSSVTQDRLASFYRTLYHHGIAVPEEYILEADYLDSKGAGELTRRLLEMKERPTCIFYPDDLSCMGGINVIRRAGLHIPEDISVVGYDGQKIAGMLRPPLVTLRQNTKMLGEKAADCLIHMIEQPKSSLVERVLVPGELIPGKSVKDLT